MNHLGSIFRVFLRVFRPHKTENKDPKILNSYKQLEKRLNYFENSDTPFSIR